MYLLYVDASGTPQVQDPQNNLYVLLGVCVHEGTWRGLERRVRGLKRQYEQPNFPIELHALDICRQYRLQDTIDGFAEMDRPARRVAYERAVAAKMTAAESGAAKRKIREDARSVQAFTHLTRLERGELYEAGLDLIGSHDGIRLFAEATDKRHFHHVTGEADSVRWSFAQLISRFDLFLQRANRTSEQPQRGIIVMDKEPTNESYLMDVVREFRENGHPYGRLECVIEIPFFVDSHFASGIQLADLASYATRRYIERADRVDSFERQNYLRIHHKFDRAGPKLHGIRHYCARGSCSCLVCAERGHAPQDEAPRAAATEPTADSALPDEST
jgi:hypothetical protein